MKVCGQGHARVPLLPDKNLWHSEQEVEWAPESVGHFGEEDRNNFPLLGLELRTVSLYPKHYTDYVTPIRNASILRL
jgi:hypothetical protein